MAIVAADNPEGFPCFHLQLHGRFKKSKRFHAETFEELIWKTVFVLVGQATIGILLPFIVHVRQF